MATEPQIKKLQEISDKILATPLDQLIQRPSWGDITFEKCQKELARTFEMLGHLKLLPIAILPDQALTTMVNALTPLNQQLDQVRSFNINQGSPAATRDQLVAQIVPQCDSFFNSAYLYIPYLSYQQGEVQKNIESMTTAVREGNRIVGELKTDVETKRKDIDEIMRAAREAAGKAGVAIFTQDFSDEVAALETQATFWLTWTVRLAAGTGFLALAALGLTVWLVKDMPTTQQISFFTTKVVLFTLAISATLWCGRMYKAVKHQASVNKHRANALRTFQAFVKAAESEGSRDAVLMETTRSIFAHGSTGYFESDGGSDGGTKVVEIVKQALPRTAANG